MAEFSNRVALRVYLRSLFGRRPQSFVEIAHKERRADGTGPMRRGEFRPAADLEGLASEIERRSKDQELWVGALPRHPNADGEIGSGKQFVTPSRVLWADFDDEKGVERLRKHQARPHLVVASGGGGVHAYWLLGDEIEARHVRRANLRLAHALGADPQSADAARILRPPGTQNLKYESPRPVELVYAGQHPNYSARQLVGSLPDPRTRQSEPGGRSVPSGPDPLRAIAPPVYVRELAGASAPEAGGFVRCPLPDHEDRTPSCYVFAEPDRGWHCYGCGRGGSIYDLASGLWGRDTKGKDFLALRHELRRRFGPAADTRQPRKWNPSEPSAQPTRARVVVASAEDSGPVAVAEPTVAPARPRLKRPLLLPHEGRRRPEPITPHTSATAPAPEAEGNASATAAAGVVGAGALTLPAMLGPFMYVLSGLFLLLILVSTFVVMFGVGQPRSGIGAGGYAPSAYALRDIPRLYLRLYREAATEYKLDWTIIAAIGKIETDHGRLRAAGVRSGVNFAGCCAGPMQFYIVGPYSTWAAYGVDGDDDGRKNVYDPRDAIPAAANYLRASGAPKDYKKAIFAYNHADWYVRDVLALAERYRGAYQRADDWSGGSGRLSWPVRGPITSRYCERRSWESCHPGIDIGVASGTPIHSAAPGRVVLMSPYGGYGNFTCVQHQPKLTTCYAHQSVFRTRLGAQVRRGQVIGDVGCTGLCFGSHLHFEVRLGGPSSPVTDPMKYLKGR